MLQNVLFSSTSIPPHRMVAQLELDAPVSLPSEERISGRRPAVDQVAERLGRISQQTGMAGMSEKMADHFQFYVPGIPRAEAQGAYMDEPGSVRNLFSFDGGVDPLHIERYAEELKQFERHARLGREKLEAFLTYINGEHAS